MSIEIQRYNHKNHSDNTLAIGEPIAVPSDYIEAYKASLISLGVSDVDVDKCVRRVSDPQELAKRAEEDRIVEGQATVIKPHAIRRVFERIAHLSTPDQRSSEYAHRMISDADNIDHSLSKVQDRVGNAMTTIEQILLVTPPNRPTRVSETVFVGRRKP